MANLAAVPTLDGQVDAASYMDPTSEDNVIENLCFGNSPRADEDQRASRTPQPKMHVTWPSREILIVDLTIHNLSQEPIAADIRLYMACFDGKQKPPPDNIEDQVKLAATQGPRVFWGGQVVPDSTMCPGGVWTSGPTALKLPQWVEHVLLVATIEGPRERSERPCSSSRSKAHRIIWSGQSPMLNDCPTEC